MGMHDLIGGRERVLLLTSNQAKMLSVQSREK